MKKGLILTLATVAVALLSTVGYGYAPVIGPIPDILIGDREDNASSVDLNFFRFTNAFNFDNYVTHQTGDEDQSTTNVRWSFVADAAGLLTINGIETLSDASEAIEPNLVGKELTAWGNNSAVPRATSNATFRDIKDSPLSGTPPFPNPTDPLDTQITIYASNGSKASSKTIAVKANIQTGQMDMPDGYSETQIVHVKLWDRPADTWNQGSYQGLGGTFINAVDGAFYIASGVTTSGGAVGAAGRSGTGPGAYGPWYSPISNDVPYVANQVYRAKYTIHTSQTDQAKVPNTRMSMQVGKGTGTGDLVAYGAVRLGKSAPFTPTATPRTYNVYFGPPDVSANTEVTALRLAFEVIDLDPAEEGSNFMDQVDVERFPTMDKSAGTLVQTMAPPAGFSAWTGSTAMPLFGTATLTNNTSGLTISTPTTVSGTAGLNYGQYTIAAASSPVSYVADKLYRCIYTLSSTASKPGKIRIINNNNTGAWSADMELDNNWAATAMPTASAKEYSVWFETLPQLFTAPADNKMTFMFDVADGTVAQSGAVLLSKIELYYYDIP